MEREAKLRRIERVPSETARRSPESRDPPPRPSRLRRLLARLASRESPPVVGPAAALRRHELTIVACDLRGFTQFSQAAGPDRVVDLLRVYYAEIGRVVATFGGTIKDHAGDGMLALVGASGPSSDHAERAVQMSLAMRGVSRRALSRWGPGLGLGIGAASGQVTVGTIEVGSRLQFVAVGPAVNLAARLCERAAAGQVLVDERTVELVGALRPVRFERLEIVPLKGFSMAVPIFEASARPCVGSDRRTEPS